MVLNSLNADHAPKNSPIIRKLTVEGKDLVCTLTADNKKQIRTGATSFFEIAILALRTLEKFDVYHSTIILGSFNLNENL